MTEYFIINSAINHSDTMPPKQKILKTIHNAGFFSCCTIRLMDIIHFFNKNNCVPDLVDSTEQFLHYKGEPGDDMIPLYFKQLSLDIPFKSEIELKDCMAFQFAPYKDLDFEALKPFINKYFTPSDRVLSSLANYEAKYNLDYSNLCAVFYRGNDKNREMKVSSYSYFIEKAKEIKKYNPEIKFLVQPDEPAFLEAFLDHFPESIYFEETPMCNNPDSCMVFELPMKERAEFGVNFFAALLALSKCNHVITHSGNCGLWAALYRGNPENIYQIFNDEWVS